MEIIAPAMQLVLAPLLPLLPWLIGLLILGAVLRSSRVKGMFGEFLVNASARWLLDRQDYHLIRDVTLPCGEGTTQIDHIIVSRYGVFVIETKNMRGWIFGSASQTTWTQKIYRHSSRFQNPLRQNYKHLKALEALLGLAPAQLHSLVVFVGDCTFRTDMPENVTRGLGYLNFIRSRREPLLTAAEVDRIRAGIEQVRLDRSWKTHRAHVTHVQNLVAAKKQCWAEARSASSITADEGAKTCTGSVLDAASPAPDSELLPADGFVPVCPKCGAPMVARAGKRGRLAGQSFWGCSRYPKCRGTRPMLSQ